MDHLYPEASIKTHMLGGVPRPGIDHIYTDMHLEPSLCAANVLLEPVAAVLSDHCPIYLGLRCPGIAHQMRPPAQPPPHRNPVLVGQY